LPDFNPLSANVALSANVVHARHDADVAWTRKLATKWYITLYTYVKPIVRNRVTNLHRRKTFL